MSAEPLTREERVANLSSTRLTRSERDLIDRYEATVQDAEERAERLRGAAIRAKAHLSDERSTAAHAAAAELLDALAADDAARPVSAEPMTREEREAWINYRDDDGCRPPFSERFDRYEATVQAEEAGRKAAEERAERLRAALNEIARVDVGGLQAIDEYVHDEKENRYESVKHLLSRVAWRRKVALSALAADDAARGER